MASNQSPTKRYDNSAGFVGWANIHRPPGLKAVAQITSERLHVGGGCSNCPSPEWHAVFVKK